MSLVDIRRACFDCLARREHSRYELKQKLLRKDFCLDDIEAVLDEFSQKKLQSDERFCDAYLRMRMRSGFGPERIRLELEKRKVGSEFITLYLGSYEDDFVSSLEREWRKKFTAAPKNINEKAKQIRFLQYRGFSSSAIRELLK